MRKCILTMLRFFCFVFFAPDCIMSLLKMNSTRDIFCLWCLCLNEMSPSSYIQSNYSYTSIITYTFCNITENDKVNQMIFNNRYNSSADRETKIGVENWLKIMYRFLVCNYWTLQVYCVWNDPVSVWVLMIRSQTTFYIDLSTLWNALIYPYITSYLGISA